VTNPKPESNRRGWRSHVLIIVQNLPIEVDRRVLLELHELLDRGYQVSLICPKGQGDASRKDIDGARIYKYAPAPSAKGLPGYVLEFAYSWLRTALLSVVAWRRGGRFDIIQACNPPDTYWLLGRVWRPFGVKFVFDQHDLNPELFLSRFGEPTSKGKALQYNGLLWLERMTYAAADRVISTNESYKAFAIRRGRRDPADVAVVRSGPDTAQMRPVYPEKPRQPGTVQLAYLGIMGPQDGVDQVLMVMAELRRRGRDEVHAVLMGFGDCLDDLRAQCTEMGLEDRVRFTGRVDRKAIGEYLSSSDIGVCPDLKTPLNDVSTMNKTMEYMAYALPSVSFDLVETRVSGGESVLYVPSGDVAAFTDEVERLITDAPLRVRLAKAARRRVSEQLDWRAQAEVYRGVFDALSGRPADEITEPRPEPSEADEWGRSYVPLDDPVEFDRYIRDRRAQ
jgi:glycosyltransferase involved in cell wall biosynthesis